MKTEPTTHGAARSRITRRHLVEGLGGLLLYVILGVVLEVLLAFKADLYVNADFETRRLMWRLAHAHGTLLSLVDLAMVVVFDKMEESRFPAPAGFISGCLTGAFLLIPGGFFLGGITVEGGDPGAAIALVPAGAFLLILALARALGLTLSTGTRQR